MPVSIHALSLGGHVGPRRKLIIELTDSHLNLPVTPSETLPSSRKAVKNENTTGAATRKPAKGRMEVLPRCCLPGPANKICFIKAPVPLIMLHPAPSFTSPDQS